MNNQLHTQDPRHALARQLEEVDEAIILLTEEAARNDMGIGSPEDKEIWDRKIEVLAVRRKVRSALNELGVTNVQFGISRGLYGEDQYVTYCKSWDPSNGPK